MDLMLYFLLQKTGEATATSNPGSSSSPWFLAGNMTSKRNLWRKRPQPSKTQRCAGHILTLRGGFKKALRDCKDSPCEGEGPFLCLMSLTSTTVRVIYVGVYLQRKPMRTRVLLTKLQTTGSFFLIATTHLLSYY